MRHLFLASFALTACLGWDSALSTTLARLDGGAAGGSGGGTASAGGGGTGGAGTGGGATACTGAYCFIDMYEHDPAIRGAVMTNLSDVIVVGDNTIDDCFTSRSTARDGGWKPINEASGLENPFEKIIGVSSDDVWLFDASGNIVHQEADNQTDMLTDMCGFQDYFWAGGVVVSTDEAWFVGDRSSVCHWVRNIGFKPATPTANAGGDLNLASIVIDNGQPLIGDSNGALDFIDGGLADTAFTDQSSVDRLQRLPTGELWALTSSNTVARRDPGGVWTRWVLIPGNAMDLDALLAVSATDVWVGGASFLAHFDGTSWNKSVADDIGPGLPASYNVHAIASTGATDLVIGGTDTSDGGATGFVSRFTRH